jgi:oxygen-independent coproporphyrinogen-3 oxidase
VARAVEAGLAPAHTVFVGGGTPSQVDPEGLGRVLDRLALVERAEVTVECNPDDVTAALAESLAAHRVNRVSLGVQSMDIDQLAVLGRHHRPANVASALAHVRAAGVTNINLDVIYGSVGESAASWRRTLASVLDLEPPHVSAYALTVEPGTPLADDPHHHPDEDLQADAYEAAEELLGEAGMTHYEISNWARPGHQCRHHLIYWDQGDYRGFGCAAHSHRGGRRWWNLHTPERYIEAVTEGLSTEAAAEVLDGEMRRREALELRLRTWAGVPPGSFSDEDRAELTTEGLVESVVLGDGEERLALTQRGRMLANEVALRLVPVDDRPVLAAG